MTDVVTTTVSLSASAHRMVEAYAASRRLAFDQALGDLIALGFASSGESLPQQTYVFTPATPQQGEATFTSTPLPPGWELDSQTADLSFDPERR